MTNNIIASVVIGASIIVGAYLFSEKTTTIQTTPTVIGTIQVSGEGEAKTTPDTVIISAGASVYQSPTQEQAYKSMNESINKIQEVAKAAGIEANKIQTSQFSLTEEYNWENGVRSSAGYSASSTITISVEKKDTSVVNSLLDQIAQIPNIVINNIGYDLSDKTLPYTDARVKALQDAKNKAEQIAKETGVTITGVQSVAENVSFDGGYYPAFAGSMAMDMNAKRDVADISLGEKLYSVNVNITYSIK